MVVLKRENIFLKGVRRANRIHQNGNIYVCIPMNCFLCLHRPFRNIFSYVSNNANVFVNLFSLRLCCDDFCCIMPLPLCLFVFAFHRLSMLFIGFVLYAHMKYNLFIFSFFNFFFAV